MSKVRHVLGISGGKDSAALAIYLKPVSYTHLKGCFSAKYASSDTI